MPRFVSILPAALALLGTAAPFAHAQTPAQGDQAAAIRISTLGIGGELSRRLSPTVDVRVGYSNFTSSGNRNVKGVDFADSLRLSNFTALGNFYPSEHSIFHLTGGLVIDDNHVSVTGKPNGAGNYVLNGTTYSAAQVGTLDGKVSFPNMGPYLGLGFGRPSADSGSLSLLFDVGVVVFNRPNLTLNASGASGNAALAADVARQRDRSQSGREQVSDIPGGVAGGFVPSVGRVPLHRVAARRREEVQRNGLVHISGRGRFLSLSVFDKGHERNFACPFNGNRNHALLFGGGS